MIGEGIRLISTRISDELPKSKLIEILAEKANERNDIDFNFISVLNDFRKVVGGEVSQINRLFPEYTPHDEQYHLKRLFHVADTLLGLNCYEQMNSTELLILSLALYGHDWGMAVSDSEKAFIVDGEGNSIFNTLPNEREKFLHYSRKNKVSNLNSDNVSLDLWRNYVRETHAFRSGERIRVYFDRIDNGLAEAVARVCEGHCLNFEDIADHKSYPCDFSVLREVVNLRALAIYVRLVDLLDLAQDRTPYVIWKFVAPQNLSSRMEWAKHRCLQPITCPEYQGGRIIRVEGSTDDHEVYAALEDLKAWCEEQFRGCSDLLARMKDSRHKLDLYNIDWRVEAKGFKPISIRFDFDRSNMMKILTSEIYQGDPYVFLRELLQNSVDAIRMRREILLRNSINAQNSFVINVSIKKHGNEHTAITWTDNGVGMDAYIVKNYLAMAGKSYYMSTDFERENFEFDPISKFGVGILSCFMVCDSLEIETEREPYFGTVEPALRIEIPSVLRQFRVEPISRQVHKVGTKITVLVDHNKFPPETHLNSEGTLDVIGYLKDVAGFVEFPIVVDDNGKMTYIFHPDLDSEAMAILKNGLEETKIEQSNCGIDWEEHFLPQDLQNAKEELLEFVLNISSDLGMVGYEGAFHYIIPKDEETDIVTDAGQTYITKLTQTEQGNKSVRRKSKENLYSILDEFEDEKVIGFTQSNKHAKYYKVYRDGILIPRVAQPTCFGNRVRDYLPYKITVNIPKVDTPKIDLARMQLLEQNQPWDYKIKGAYLRYIATQWTDRILSVDPLNRFYLIGRLLAYHHVSMQELLQMVPIEKVPIPMLGPTGEIRIVDFCDIKDDVIVSLPSDFFDYDAFELLENAIKKREYTGILTQWTGESCIIESKHDYDSESISSAFDLIGAILRSYYLPNRLEFCSFPWSNPPLAQLVFTPTKPDGKKYDNALLLKKLIYETVQVSKEEWRHLNRIFGDYGYYLPKCIEFCAPFENKFSFAWKYININNKTSLNFIKIIASIVLSKSGEELSASDYGRIHDVLRRLPMSSRVIDDESDRIIDVLFELQNSIEPMNLFSQYFPIVPLKEEIIPAVDDMVVDAHYRKEKYKPFGERLK